MENSLVKIIKDPSKYIIMLVKKVIIIIILLAIFILAGINIAQASGQWETVSPAGTSGYTFNTVATIDDYVFLGTNHGIYRSTDKGVTWTQINTGLSNQNINAIAIGWTYDLNNGKYSVDGSTLIFAATPAGVFKNTLNGDSWTAVNSGLNDTNVYDIEFDQYQALMLGAADTVYAGTFGTSAASNGVYKTPSQSVNWVQTDDTILAGERIKKIATDFGAGYIYALSNTNKLYSSTLFSLDGTSEESWTQIYSSSPTINDITIINGNGYINYLATNNGVLKSDESGTNWTAQNTGLDDLNINTVITNYMSPGIAYAASANQGVFKSIDDAVSWTKINKGLVAANIKDIETNPNNDLLVYAISASGAYRLELNDAYDLPVATDTTAPASINDLTAISVTTNSVTLAWTAPADPDGLGRASTYDLRYSTANITSVNWASAAQVSNEPVPQAAGMTETFTVTGLSANTTYYFAIKSADEANNISNLSVIASTKTSAGDITPPTITNISSDKANGSYGVGEVVDIDLTFSELVTSTGNVTVTLETGTTDRQCTFTLSNATTGGCNYTVQAGDTSSDLDVKTISGTIKDAAQNAMTNFTPATNLATNKNLVIDTTAPTISSISSTVTANSATISWTTNEAATSQINYGLTTSYTATTTLDTNLVTAHSVTINGLSASTLYHYRVRSKDIANNEKISADKNFTTTAATNNPPVMTSVTITPNPAYKTTANLTANPVATDADGDPVTFTYQWKKGGVNISGQTSSTLANTNYVKSDVITVTVTPNDGKTNGTAMTSAGLTIANSVPVMSTVTITPSPAYKTTANLTANVTATDADSDTITYSYQWKKGGVNISGQTSSTLANTNYVKSDVITVTVTPNDGTTSGTAMTSAGLTIANSLPTQPTVSITTPAYDSTNLVCTPTGSSDADGDTISFSYAWYKNTVLQAGLTTNTVNASNTTVGDSWRCVATPNDGTTNGTAGEATVTIIADLDITPPIISNIASVTTVDTAAISWTTNEAATSQVEYGLTTSYGSATILDPNMIISHSVNINGLTVNTIYHYRVKTKDASNNERISDDYTFKTTDIPDTTSPILTVVTPIADFPIGSDFDYTYNSSEAGTVSYSGCSASLYPSAIAGVNPITFDQPADGTYADCTIRVTDAAGNISLPLSVNTFIVDTIKPVITNLVVNTSTSSATLAWTTDELSISSVNYGLTNILPYPLNQSATGITTSPWVIITGLATSTTYYYRIISVDLSGNIAFLDGLSLTTAADPDVTAPTLTDGQPSGSLAANTTEVTLSVSSDENAICKYSTTTGTAYDAMSNSFTTTGAKTHTTQVSGLTNGQNYNYYIRCQDLSGNANTTDYIISFSVANPPASSGGGGGGGYIPLPDLTAPGLPTNFIATTSGAKIVLSWTNPADADFYGVVIIRKENSAPSSRNDGVNIYEGKASNFIDTAVEVNKLYYYSIYARDNNSNYTNGVTLSIYNSSDSNTVAQTGNDAVKNQVEVLSWQANYSLAGAVNTVVEQVSQNEANSVYNYNQFSQLDKTSASLYDKLIYQKVDLNTQSKYALAYFIQTGSPTTARLGAGERAGVIASFQAAFGRLPLSAEDWQEVIKIANGRWTGQRSKTAEDKAVIAFKKVYQRFPDLKNNKDNNALMIMAYGLRPAIRNLQSEKNAIKIFKNIYGKNPQSASDWDIVRTIAYSGTKR